MAKTRGFSSAKRSLSDLVDDLEDDMNKVGRSGAESLQQSAKGELSEPNVFGSPTSLTGSLKHGIHTDESHKGHVHEHVLVSSAPHGRFIEFGTGFYNLETAFGRNFKAPSFTPRLRKNIKAWIILRNIRPRNAEMSVDELSWVIAQSIAERGTRRQAFMKPAYHKNRHAIMRKAKAAFRKAVK